MKSLIIWNGVASEQISGGDSYTINLINLSKIKKDVVLPKNAQHLIERNKAEELLLTRKNTSKNPLLMALTYFIRTIQSIWKLGKEKKDYNLLITSTPFFFDIIPAIFAKAKNKAAVIFHIVPKRKSVSLSTFFRFLAAGIEKRISYFFIKHYFDTIIAGNEVVKKELKHIFPHQKIISTNASINTKKIDSINEKKKDSNTVSFMGRITSQKGVFDLIDIMNSLSMKYPHLKLIVMGDGPDKLELMRRIKEKKTKSIILKGFVNEREKYAILKKSKFFFFPSYEEGWGIALAEAMYCNDICICYSLPHYKGIFGNYPKYAKLGSKSDFIKKFESSCNSKPDKNQKDFVARYDDQKVVDDVINEVL